MAKVVEELAVVIRQKGAKETARAMKGIEKQTDKTTSSLTKMAAQFVTIGAAIGGTKGVIKLFLEQERVERRLAATTKRLGDTSGQLAQHLKREAAALQQVSIHGDEAWMATQRMLIDLGANSENIDIATKAVGELSAALEMDLSSASRLVGQALAGNVQTLARYIPEVRKLTKEQIEAGEAIQMVIDKLGGSMAAEAGTLSGSLTQTKNAMFDMGEIIGSKFVPAIELVNTALRDAIKFWDKFVTKVDARVGAAGSAVHVFGSEEERGKAGTKYTESLQALSRYTSGQFGWSFSSSESVKALTESEAQAFAMANTPEYILANAEALGLTNSQAIEIAGMVKATREAWSYLQFVEEAGKGYGSTFKGALPKPGKTPPPAPPTKPGAGKGKGGAGAGKGKEEAGFEGFGFGMGLEAQGYVNEWQAGQDAIAERVGAATDKWVAEVNTRLEADRIAAAESARAWEDAEAQKQAAAERTANVTGKVVGNVTSMISQLAAQSLGQQHAVATVFLQQMLQILGTFAIARGTVAAGVAKAEAYQSFGASLLQLAPALLLAAYGSSLGGSGGSAINTTGGGSSQRFASGRRQEPQEIRLTVQYKDGVGEFGEVVIDSGQRAIDEGRRDGWNR